MKNILFILSVTLFFNVSNISAQTFYMKDSLILFKMCENNFIKLDKSIDSIGMNTVENWNFLPQQNKNLILHLTKEFQPYYIYNNTTLNELEQNVKYEFIYGYVLNNKLYVDYTKLNYTKENKNKNTNQRTSSVSIEVKDVFKSSIILDIRHVIVNSTYIKDIIYIDNKQIENLRNNDITINELKSGTKYNCKVITILRDKNDKLDTLYSNNIVIYTAPYNSDRCTKCSEYGFDGIYISKKDEPKLYTQVQASNVCKQKGYGWQLPNRKELENMYNNDINLTPFNFYWSSDKNEGIVIDNFEYYKNVILSNNPNGADLKRLIDFFGSDFGSYNDGDGLYYFQGSVNDYNSVRCIWKP